MTAQSGVSQYSHNRNQQPESDTRGRTTNILSFFTIPLLLMWPFIYLFKHVIPLNGTYTGIGNDFYPYYYKYKVYLLAHLAEGQIPLWSPSEASGFPFFSSPLTQFLYPLNIPLVLWYKLSGGYDAIDHQIFTIFGLSIFAVGLYFWLRLLNSNGRAILFSVLIMSVSFRMTETLRFPNAIHSAAWYPWILYALTRISTVYSKRKLLVSAGILVFSWFCLCTAGYPYFLYYFLFLLFPYCLLLALPWTRKIVFGIPSIQWKQTLITIGICAVLVCMSCLPYLISVKQLMNTTFNRTGHNFNYSTAHAFTAQDTLGSLIYPPLSQWEGWYFFGLTGLFMISIFFVRSLFTRSGNTSVSNTAATHSEPRRWAVSLVLLIWIAMISYISYGKESYLFKLLWQVMPGFSSLRVWGRINIILIPLISWLLCFAYADFETFVLKERWKTQHFLQSKTLTFCLVFGAFYLLVFLVQFYLHRNTMIDHYWEKYAKNMEQYRFWFLLAGFIAFLSITFFVTFGRFLSRRIRYITVVMFVVLWVVSVVEMWPVGTRIWEVKRKVVSPKVSLDLKMYHSQAFARPRVFKKSTVMLEPRYTAGLGSPNWYFKNYIDFLRRHQNEQKHMGYLLGLADSRKIFFSEKIDYKTIKTFLADALRFQQPGDLISYDGDVLIWEIDAPTAGYLSYIDNWDPYWKVFVDDQEQKLERLFGTFKSVYLTEGKHRVEFRYEPRLRSILNNIRE